MLLYGLVRCGVLILLQLSLNIVGSGVKDSSLLEAERSPGECVDIMFRPIDGVCNNEQNSSYGATYATQARGGPPRYLDATGIVDDIGRPTARVISNTIFAQNPTKLENFKRGSVLGIFFCQFVDHDLALTELNVTERLDVHVEEGDSMEGPMTFERSLYREHPTEIRSFQNQITSLLDLSNVYGSTDEVASKLRSHVGGKLLTNSNGFLPLNKDVGLTLVGLTPPKLPARYACGDSRCNENPVSLRLSRKA